MQINKCDGCRYAGEHQEMGFMPFGVCTKETNLIKAEQNYNAECCPYIVDAYATGTAEELQKTFDDLKGETDKEIFQEALKKIQQIGQKLAETLIPIIEKITQIFNVTSETILNCYPNKKVVHLALHHPKQRVRKKNIHRIMRWIEKGK